MRSIIFRILYILVVTLYGFVNHNGLWRVPEHLCYVEVEGFYAVALTEREVCVAGSLAYNIQRGTFTFGNLTYIVYMLLVDEQSHALLTLVGDNLLCRECLVADGQLGHIYLAATLLDELRQTVYVTCRTVVVDAYHRVLVALDECSYEVISTFLHFRVGTLNGVKLDAVRVASCINGRDTTSTETDAVVITTYYNHFVAFLWFAFQAVALLAVAHTACKHYHLVVCVRRVLLFMFKGKYRTADKRLTELVSEVGGSV